MSEIKINMLNTNEEIHAENKELFDEEGIFVINLMRAPGSGKTSILEKLIPKLKHKFNMGKKVIAIGNRLMMDDAVAVLILERIIIYF